jgi:hypothetical protein
MWFDLVLDVLIAIILIPIIIGAVATHGERRKRIAPQGGMQRVWTPFGSVDM